MGKDMFEKTMFKNISSSGISIMIPSLSMDRMYSLPEFQNRQDFHGLYKEYVELMEDRYGKGWVNFNLAETTVLLDIITEISGDNIFYIMKCEDCEYGEMYRQQLLDGVKSCIEYLRSHSEWSSKEKEFYTGCKNKWCDGWTDRDVAMESLKELEEFLSYIDTGTVVIEDDMCSCEHENIWYAADVYRREMEIERLKMLGRMLEELNCMEYTIRMANDGVLVDDGDGGEVPIEMMKASNELETFIMFASDREMKIMFGKDVDKDLYNCFDDAQHIIDRWLNL